MCDRGSNFIRGLRDYSPIYCYAHRLNNILKRCFWQTKRQRINRTSPMPTTTFNTSDLSSSSDDEDEPMISTTIFDLQRIDRTYASRENDPIPECVVEILKTIDHSKKLVRYIRRVSSSNNPVYNEFHSSLFRLD